MVGVSDTAGAPPLDAGLETGVAKPRGDRWRPLLGFVLPVGAAVAWEAVVWADLAEIGRAHV